MSLAEILLPFSTAGSCGVTQASDGASVGIFKKRKQRRLKMADHLRLLIVATAGLDARVVQDELERGGCELSAEVVDTRATLIAELSRPGWELVVAGYGGAGLDALEVLDLLRQREMELPVIAVCATPDEEVVVSLLKAGTQDCVTTARLDRLCPAVRRELKEGRRSTPRRPVEEHLDESEQRYRTLIEEIPALTYAAWADELGNTAYVSPQITGMLGFTPSEWLAEPECWSRQLHPEDRERVLAEYQKSWRAGAPFASEYRILTRQGHVRWWRDEGRVLPDAAGRPQVVRGFVLDITDRKIAEETIRYMTYHDPLTGLPNRTLLHERLQGAIERSRRDDSSVALLILALDRFREIGHVLGQENSDRIIKELAERLGDLLGDGDRVARLRGDEFAMLVPGAGASLAQNLGWRVLKKLEEPFMISRLSIEVGGSIGIAVTPDHANHAEVLLRRADFAVQAARQGGGGCVVYSSACDPYDPARVALLGELRRAIEANELRLHYQPKVNIKSRSVVGAEALLRWPHAKRGLIPPSDFVPLAEQGGLIKLLTRWVLEQALRQCRDWERQGWSLPVAVNLSVRNLQDPQLVEQLVGLLAEHAVTAQRLTLEVTESAVMVDPVRGAEILCKLKASGISLSIDDFGTGYSSLAYLKSLPVSELKIDKSFVTGLGESDDDGNATIVRSTSDLGHALGLSVVAEGVEDQRTLDLLDSFGCDGAQGFHIARPMPPRDFGEWLSTSAWRASAWPN